jgi:hypothetical protein
VAGRGRSGKRNLHPRTGLRAARRGLILQPGVATWVDVAR